MKMSTREHRMRRVALVVVMVLSVFSGAGVSGYDVLMDRADDSAAARYDVFGSTVNSDGSALSGVLIGLKGDGVTQKTVSSTDGSFRFSSVPPGSYAIDFKMKGKKKVKREITLSNGDLDLGKITIE
jgi:hypothetical protein